MESHEKNNKTGVHQNSQRTDLEMETRTPETGKQFNLCLWSPSG